MSQQTQQEEADYGQKIFGLMDSICWPTHFDMEHMVGNVEGILTKKFDCVLETYVKNGNLTMVCRILKIAAKVSYNYYSFVAKLCSDRESAIELFDLFFNKYITADEKYENFDIDFDCEKLNFLDSIIEAHPADVDQDWQLLCSKLNEEGRALAIRNCVGRAMDNKSDIRKALQYLSTSKELRAVQDTYDEFSHQEVVFWEEIYDKCKTSVVLISELDQAILSISEDDKAFFFGLYQELNKKGYLDKYFIKPGCRLNHYTILKDAARKNDFEEILNQLTQPLSCSCNPPELSQEVTCLILGSALENLESNDSQLLRILELLAHQ